jgi:hypothetical protein
LIAGMAIVCAGAVKWKRYAELRERIAKYSREEKLLRDEYQQRSRLRETCGLARRTTEAYLEVANERRREIESCEQALKRIW